MVTSEPVRDRMVALTRSMSAATRATSWSIDAAGWLSKGTITATPVSTFAQSALILGYNNRNCQVRRQGRQAVDTAVEAIKQFGREGSGLRELVRTNDIVL